ncbi:MAG: class I SAM-dependent methyltransferase [Planctomycetaceae bacterium]|nr:class I SAM-dependent methyltransferase [Planctomycetaceae bacterium]
MFLQNDRTWHGAYKIPWDDPGFSRRMLREHLSQDHDMASRRAEWIDKQVAWIHEYLLGELSSRVLDLGCGPGFYSHRLATRGHRCHGIDFGPASIEYAQEHNPDPRQCTFLLGDIRHAAYGGPYDLAMMVFGEFNVFAPDEALALLRKVAASLRPKGRLILETQTWEAIERAGHSEPFEQRYESGLFSDQPYHCRTENRWLPDEEVTVQTFAVTETGHSQTRAYRNTTRAWSDVDLARLLTAAGFAQAAPCQQWPCNTDALRLWIAVTP